MSGKRRAAWAFAAISPVAVAVASWTAGGWLSAPVPRLVGAPPAALGQAREVRFPSASGSTVHAWFVHGESGKATVVLGHPVRGDRRNMVSRARFLSDAGYAVLLFDAQAHGESSGEQITFGWLEAHDAHAAVRFAARERPGPPVAYLGVSQGGAAAVLGPQPLPVAALVLEAVYTTLEEAVQNRLAIRLGGVGRRLAPLLLWQFEPRLGLDPDAVAPLRGVASVTSPVLVIAGERDAHATLAQSKRLFEAAPDRKEWWMVPDAHHQDFHRLVPDAYEQRVLQFFDDHL